MFFYATKFMAICYNGNRKLIPVLKEKIYQYLLYSMLSLMKEAIRTEECIYKECIYNLLVNV